MQLRVASARARKVARDSVVFPVVRWSVPFVAAIASAVAACASSAHVVPERAPSERSVSEAPAPASPSDGVPLSSPAEYADRPISAEAGAEYFLQDGAGDPYAAGLAYPVWLGLMEAYPDALGRDWNEFADRFGFVRDPDAKGDPRRPPIGFHLTTDPITHVPWVVSNCQMCHADRLRLPSGDVVVAGLGNKRVRSHAYADALLRIGADAALDDARVEALATKRATAWDVPWNPAARRAIVRAELAGLRALAGRTLAQTTRFDAALPGRAATIESFAIALDAYRDSPIPLPSVTGWAKVPDVVGFPYRDTFSWDASGFGSPQALVLEASFVFGTRPAWYLTHAHVATSMYLYLRSFRRTLPFPGPIDAARAARGHDVFGARCARCHGVYEKHGGETRVTYRETVVPADVVGTDPARAEAVTTAFVDAANELPLTRGLTRVRKTGGYVPPVLLDVWARGLYGHVGQWPSLAVLATPPGDRPRRFVVDTDGVYDLERVGVRYDDAPPAARPLRASEYVYDGSVPGYGVDGHPFLSNLGLEERRAVIEYLKTL
jgi:mono/diheme cytochrome c family protein